MHTVVLVQLHVEIVAWLKCMVAMLSGSGLTTILWYLALVNK